MTLQSKFKVAVISLDIVRADRQANLTAMRHAIDSVDPDTDLLVLPELFSTGFTTDKDLAMQLAETNSGVTIDAVTSLAKDNRMAIAGSFLASTAGRLYNRAFFIEPSGEEYFYDKRHLFSMSSEASVLAKGDELPFIARYRGWNIAMVVCYDMRFPAWCRNLDCAYDMLIVPANWPKSREHAWRSLVIARAIENQAYVVGANRSGSDKFGDYDGTSLISDFIGNDIGMPMSDNSIIYAEFDKERLDDYRHDFPAWRDSDRFSIG